MKHKQCKTRFHAYKCLKMLNQATLFKSAYVGNKNIQKSKKRAIMKIKIVIIRVREGWLVIKEQHACSISWAGCGFTSVHHTIVFF